jgi:hypothetical protein
MLATFTVLLAAHIAADFVLQPEWLVRRKRNPVFLVLHTLVVVAVTAICVGGTPVALLALIAGTHLLIDAAKAYLSRDTLRAFVADQVAHCVVIAAASQMWPGTFDDWWWSHWLGVHRQWFLAAVTLIAGVIVNLHFGAIIIRKATARFSRQITAPIAGLQDGGTYIGWMERAIVMVFILMNQPAGIGFLITAKSILRFGDVKESRERQLTEYIIIGTFMSFAWGLVVSAVTQYMLKRWGVL